MAIAQDGQRFSSTAAPLDDQRIGGQRSWQRSDRQVVALARTEHFALEHVQRRGIRGHATPVVRAVVRFFG
jgi:hypothetical protein